MKILKNRILSLTLTVVMTISLFLAFIPAFAKNSDVTWYFTEDFSSFTTNSTADNVTITSGTPMVLENTERTNKYHSVSAKNGNIAFSQAFKTEADINDFKFSIDVGFSGDISGATINLTSSNGNFAVAKIGGDKSVNAYDGKKVGTLSSSSLTTLLFEFNSEHSRYSIYINGKKAINDYYIDIACPTVYTGYSINVTINAQTAFYVDEIYAYASSDIVSKAKLPKSIYSELYEEVYEYEDIFINDRRIISSENFEPDPRKYHELVKNFSMYHYPYDHVIEEKQEEDGNHYLSYEGGASGQNYFSTITLGSGQQAVLEFDVCTPTLSVINVDLYDNNNNYIDLIQSDTGLKITSNKQTVGYLDARKWVRIAISIDNDKKLVNIYVDGEHTGVDIPMASDKLIDLRSIRFYGARTYDRNHVMLDNIISYLGTELYDYSKILNDEIDYGSTTYNHNTKGVEEFLKSYNAIHTVTGKLYVDSLDKVTKMPYWENDVLYVALPDAEKLIFGKATSSSDEYIALESYANENGKKVTYNATNTVLVGDKEAVISDMMIKYVNAYMTYDRPDAKELIDSFNNNHPRILINDERIEKLKLEYGKDEHITKWANTFISQSDKYLTVDPQVFVEMDGGDGRLLVPARTVKERIQKLAISYFLTGKHEYVDRAWLEIENACNFPYWHQGKNELDSTFMAGAIAYGYDWLYDEWTESQRKIMEDALCKNQLDQAQEAYHGIRTYGSFSADNNWNPHCNAYTAIGAIAIFETNPEKYADIISNAIKMLDYAILDFYPDGAWKEGTGYWSGTVLPIAELCPSLQYSFGSSYNIENTDCFDITCDYVIGNAGPTGNNNYNDTSDSESSAPAYMWFANTFNNPTYAIIRLKELDLGVSGLHVVDFCLFDTDMELEEAQEKLDYYFGGLELVAFKSANGDPNATYVSFHSGNNLGAVAHSHIDSGTFVMDMMGERFAWDPGSHYYFVTGHGQAPNAQPADDGDTITRWDYYNHIPEGHNTFIINPDDKTVGQNIVTNDKMETVVTKPRGAFAITSLSSAYKGYAKNARRGVMLGDDRRSVTVRDEILLNDGDNDIYWFTQLSVLTDVTFVDDKTFIMELNGKKVKAMILTNADSIEMSEGDCTQLFLTPAPEQIPIKTLKRLTIKLKAKGNVYFQVKYIPYDDPMANNPPEDIPLDSWSIPDGDIQELPSITNLYLDGVKADRFNPESSVNIIPVDVTLTQAPTLTWDISDEFDAEITKYSSDIDDVTYIRTWRKDNPALYRLYNIKFNPYSIEKLEPYRITPVSAEANDIPQQENSPEKTYDKNIGTYWGAEGKDKQLIADLGEVKNINFVGVAFKNGDARVATYQLYVSKDKENWEMIFDGVSSGTTADIELSEKIDKDVRYIKFVGFGNTSNEWNSVGELCAYSLGHLK